MPNETTTTEEQAENLGSLTEITDTSVLASADRGNEQLKAYYDRLKEKGNSLYNVPGSTVPLVLAGPYTPPPVPDYQMEAGLVIGKSDTSQPGQDGTITLPDGTPLLEDPIPNPTSPDGTVLIHGPDGDAVGLGITYTKDTGWFGVPVYGIKVDSVSVGSPFAQKLSAAGVTETEFPIEILAINGNRIPSVGDFEAMFQMALDEGEPIRLTVWKPGPRRSHIELQIPIEITPEEAACGWANSTY